MKFIDFFAGIGGFRRGMELAGHECVGFCEFDKFATASYISMHLLTEEQRKTLEDIPIKKRQKEILKEEYRNGEWYANDIRRVYAGDIPKADCWCFGFPCQDISVAGKQAGFQGNRSSLFFRVMYLVGQLKEEDKPTYLFIENVKNLLSVNGGWDFARLLIEMEQWGYDAEWQVLNSKDFRVPQNRERCFIIGHLRGRSTSKVFPIEGTDGENSVSLNLFGCLNGRNSQRDRVYSGDGLAPTISTKPRGNTEPKVSIKIIGEINSSQDGKILSTDGIANCHSAGHRNNPKIAIPVLTPDRAEKRQNGRRFKEDGEPMFTLTSQDRHGVATSLNPLGGLYTEVSKEFYRGIYEGCFRCLKASTHDSGVALKLNVLNINSNKGIFVKVSDELIVYAVWYEKYQCYIAIRKLTPRECFRLQGWSDDYFEKAQFVNSDSQLYKQAGNGVTVTVIEAMARKMNVNLN
jgi:DNA (cytosine-5)-methyltransferase 1|nr:MAG TPA: Cytosine specific methyltransferase [Caudoviricetes sp.]